MSPVPLCFRRHRRGIPTLKGQPALGRSLKSFPSLYRLRTKANGEFELEYFHRVDIRFSVLTASAEGGLLPRLSVVSMAVLMKSATSVPVHFHPRCYSKISL
jgi:hypothetical protein